MKDLLFFVRFLYQAVRFRLLIWLALIIVAAMLEGLTIGLFIPLLSSEEDESGASRYVKDAFELFGFEYSIGLVLGFMAAFFVLRSGFLIFQEIFASRLLTRILVRSKKNLVAGLFHSEYQYFVRNEVGYFINAVTIEYNRVVFAFEMCMTLAVATGFGLVYFALPLSLDPIVSATILVLFAPLYFVLRKINQLTREYSVRTTAINARLQSYLLQIFHNYKYLKATHSGTGILQKVDHSAEQQGEVIFWQSVLSAFANKGAELLLLLLVAGLLFYNTVILDADFVAMLFLLFLLRRAIMFALQAQMSYRKFIGASGSIEVFQRLETELAENREELKIGGATPDFGQPIRLENASFFYDADNYILENIDLVIPPKKTVAVVGASGAGKSTFATLLTGMLKPTSGEIFLGDQSFANLDKQLLRQGIGYVTQESVIFNDTIRNNINLWSDDADDDKIEAAAARAYLTEFVQSLPKGYETTMGDSGINISGGQRQRINIARELYKDVKLLIFDEATSSLDTQAEGTIQSNIDEFRGDKTVVIIAHRLSTVKNSDMIFVLKDGKIVERGPYDDLYALGGEFTAMVDRQALSRGETQSESAVP
jgi:ABC-type multidrug transport system fused ATPase/permease subunit